MFLGGSRGTCGKKIKAIKGPPYPPEKKNQWRFDFSFVCQVKVYTRCHRRNLLYFKAVVYNLWYAKHTREYEPGHPSTRPTCLVSFVLWLLYELFMALEQWSGDLLTKKSNFICTKCTDNNVQLECKKENITNNKTVSNLKNELGRVNL